VSKEKATKEAAPVETEAASPETKYHQTEILANCQAFGVRLEVLAGALRLDQKDWYTRTEVEALIKQFRERKV